MYSSLLAEYMYQMHRVKIIWTPAYLDEQPPF